MRYETRRRRRSTKTSRKQTKKSGEAPAAVAGSPIAPVTEAAARPAPEVRATTGLNGVTVEGGRANVAVSLDIPQPTMAENPKAALDPVVRRVAQEAGREGLRRLAQTVANLEHVSRTVEAHAAARAASKPAVLGNSANGRAPERGSAGAARFARAASRSRFSTERLAVRTEDCHGNHFR